MRFLSAILLTFACSAALAVDMVDFEKLPSEINQYLRTKKMTPELKDAFELLRLKKTMKSNTKSVSMKLLDGLGEKEASKAICDSCNSLVSTIFSWVDAGDSREVIIDKYVDLCTSINFATPTVCRATAEIKVDLGIWLYTTKNSTQYPITPQDVCGFSYFADCWVGGPQYEWTLDLAFLGPKPTPETPQLPEPSAPTLKVLQFTDIHVDPNYLVGGNAECEDLNCCRADQGAPATPEAAAGYWGDYRDCDTPFHAFEDMLAQAATHTDIAYIIFTGDVVDHGTWATSQSTNRDNIIYAMTAMLSRFPSLKILPIMGNHESHPTHNFVAADLPEVPTDLSSTWLYSLADYIWSSWIPNANETIRKGGFYSYEVNQGLKVVALNNIFCYNYNWWLLYDNVDPADQLIWFAQELLAAEQKGQKVHVLAHIPSSSDCMPNWQTQYLRILDRFENTVVAMFHGHTHNEHLNVYYDPNDRTRPTGVGFIGGSGTAFSNVNPNYRIYTVDGDYSGSSYRVLDHETWSFNLTEANLNGPSVPPAWSKLYSFKDTFGLNSLLPQDLDAFVSRLATDPALQDQYYRYYWTAGDPSLATPCDDTCRRNLVCEIVRTTQGDDSKCADFLP